jgi:hypothetical protein
MNARILLLVLTIMSACSISAQDYYRLDLYRYSPNLLEEISTQKKQRWDITTGENRYKNIVPSIPQTPNDNTLQVQKSKKLYQYNKEDVRADLEYFKTLSKEEIAYRSSFMTDGYLFSYYYLYSNQNYLDCIRQRPGYENSILELHKDITDDYYFRKSLEGIPGFKKKEFLKFIDTEAARIKTAQVMRAQEEQQRKVIEAKRQAILKVCNDLKKEFEQHAVHTKKANNQKLICRHQQRIDALNLTIKQNAQQSDYSKQIENHTKFKDPGAKAFNNCYGTALDKQLHEELCETRATVLYLQTTSPDNHHIQTISPVIYHIMRVME